MFQILKIPPANNRLQATDVSTHRVMLCQVFNAIVFSAWFMLWAAGGAEIIFPSYSPELVSNYRIIMKSYSNVGLSVPKA